MTESIETRGVVFSSLGAGTKSLISNAVLALAAALVPALGLGSYQLFVATLVVVYVIVGLGVDVVYGFGGAISIGTIGFYALGAYSGVLLARSGYDLLVILPAVLVVGAFAGAALGTVSMRLRGFGFAIVTYGFAVVVETGIIALPKLTGGLIGLSVPVPVALGISLESPRQIYYLALACAAVFIACNALVRVSYLGRALLAVQASETMARSVGIRPAPHLIAALAYSGASAAVGGMVFVFASQYIASPAFNPIQSVTFFALVVIGGVRSNIGVVLGAMIVVWLPSLLQSTAELSNVIFGVALTAALILSPRGLVGFASSVARTMQRRLSAKPESGDASAGRAAGGGR